MRHRHPSTRAIATALLAVWCALIASGCGSSSSGSKIAVDGGDSSSSFGQAPPGEFTSSPTLRPIAADGVGENLGEEASRALGRIGAAAVPDLARALSDVDVAIRRRACETLARIGPEAKDAVPALIRALDDNEPAVRRAAARALGEIGPAAAPAVPALIQALKEPSLLHRESTERGVAPASHEAPP